MHIGSGRGTRSTQRVIRPRVLIIAPHGSYRTAPFIQAAPGLGVDVLVASQGEYSIVSDYMQGLHIPADDPETALELITEEAARRPLAGIIGTDDVTTELAAQAAQTLGLAHNDPYAVRIARRKDLARAALQKAQVPVPVHRLLDLRQPLAGQVRDFPFPAVVKPIALSASRGVIRVDDVAALEQAVLRIQAILAGEAALEPEISEQLLLEAFVPGMEVALEGMLYSGRLELLTVFDKPDPMQGPFFEETYYITPSSLPAERVQQLQEQVQAACLAYGLREGPVHAECRLNEAGIWVLEVAARTIGGLCGRLLRFGTGHSLETLVLAHAMGQRLDTCAAHGAMGVLMIPIPCAGVLKRIEGILAAQRVPFVDEVNIQVRPGYELVPLPEGASYLGFIFARAPDRDRVEQALRQAHACLHIVVGPLWKAQVA